VSAACVAPVASAAWQELADVLVLCGPGGTLGTEPGRVMRQGQRRRL